MGIEIEFGFMCRCEVCGDVLSWRRFVTPEEMLEHANKTGWQLTNKWGPSMAAFCKAHRQTTPETPPPFEAALLPARTIQLVNGQNVPFEDFDPASISIEALAHSFAQTPRFGGHQLDFVSVAEHSVLVAQVLEGELARPDLAFEGLMHDIHEPISGGDMPRPYKNSAYFAPAAVLEARSAARLRTHFGLPPELSELVHQADMMVFAAECEQNTSGPLRETRKPYKAANIQLRYWTWKEAKAQFMAAFERLAQRAAR